MSMEFNQPRRHFLGSAALGIAVGELSSLSKSFAQEAPSRVTKSVPLIAGRTARAGVLDVAYYEAGPADGQVVLLLHGYPYDIQSFKDVAPLLVQQGYRVIVPHLRGHGTTVIRDNSTSRSGQQAAIGLDVVALMDSLQINKAVFAGFDWGGRAACVAAALWPERCSGLVSVNSYLIQDIAKASLPAPAKVECGIWYQHYFQTERGHAGLDAHRADIARILWANNSPTWHFDDATFLESAASFNNADYVDVVIHSYRHRLGGAPGYPEYAELEKRLAAQPTISVSTITLDGDSDGVVPATDGSSTASKFSGRREHRVAKGVGHNLPQEAPVVFAKAVVDVTKR